MPEMPEKPVLHGTLELTDDWAYKWLREWCGQTGPIYTMRSDFQPPLMVVEFQRVIFDSPLYETSPDVAFKVKLDFRSYEEPTFRRV